MERRKCLIKVLNNELWNNAVNTMFCGYAFVQSKNSGKIEL
jgi:hypothetical protein